MAPIASTATRIAIVISRRGDAAGGPASSCVLSSSPNLSVSISSSPYECVRGMWTRAVPDSRNSPVSAAAFHMYHMVDTGDVVVMCWG
jgi:hypothetical protein